jgi:alpha-N-acetylglucosaminidase
LPQIASNLGRALESPDRGKLEGMGTMMEGLDYNPVTYQLISDLMWESRVPELNDWKNKYLLARYGNLNDTLSAAWDRIFSHYYSQSGQFEVNPVIRRPFLVKDDIRPSEDAVRGASGLLSCASAFRGNDAYRFDLVNIFRQVFGQYAGHLLYEVTKAYESGNMGMFDRKVKEFNDLTSKLERLMETREEFLFGKWITDSRKHASSPEEEKLYEWNARAIITTWGGRVLYGYAIKDWAGLYSTYYLPKWTRLFDAMKRELSGGKKLDMESMTKELIAWEDEWINKTDTNLLAIPAGSSVELAESLWAEYGDMIIGQGK